MIPSDNTGLKQLIKWGAISVAALCLLLVFFGAAVNNENQNWQIIQTAFGDVKVIDEGGYHTKWFGHVWTYPRNEQVEYDKEYVFPVTFNDGGTAKMGAMVRFSMPLTVGAKLEFHRQFGGNMANVEAAVWAHLFNCMKSSGPVMSASEHQSARQSEFNQLVQEQLNGGLFETRKVERQLHDQTDDKGKAITVYATEVVLDDKGKPRFANPSPLTRLDINITQFNITHIEYDEQTKKQFAQKKEAFLAAENSKAQREKEVQERLMVEQKGLREKAENEAIANKTKASAVIAAQQAREVAELDANREKTVAETNAARTVTVALQTKAAAETAAAQEKSVAETKAAQELAVAQLQRQAAEENAKKQVVLAEAQKQSLALGGAISEKERVLAEIEREKAIGVAQALSRISVPATVISNAGGATAGDGSANLVNLFLMERLGVLKPVASK